MAGLSRMTGLVLIILLAVQVSACVTISTDDAQDIGAQETLQAVYAEQTAAAAEPEEEVRSSAVAAQPHPPSKPGKTRTRSKTAATVY